MHHICAYWYVYLKIHRGLIVHFPQAFIQGPDIHGWLTALVPPAISYHFEADGPKNPKELLSISFFHLNQKLNSITKHRPSNVMV